MSGHLRFCDAGCADSYRCDVAHGVITHGRTFAAAGCCSYCGAHVPTNAERRAGVEEVRTLRLPHSEVCMFMGVAGQDLDGRLVSSHAVQLLRDGRPFSAPITAGEAGWGRHGSDHTLTDFDESGRWYPKGTMPKEAAAA